MKKIMKVEEWIDRNDRFEEAIMFDIEGKPCLSWVENDPKYKANVIKVEQDKEKEYLANVYTDYKEGG